MSTQLSTISPLKLTIDYNHYLGTLQFFVLSGIFTEKYEEVKEKKIEEKFLNSSLDVKNFLSKTEQQVFPNVKAASWYVEMRSRNIHWLINEIKKEEIFYLNKCLAQSFYSVMKKTSKLSSLLFQMKPTDNIVQYINDLDEIHNAIEKIPYLSTNEQESECAERRKRYFQSEIDLLEHLFEYCKKAS